MQFKALSRLFKIAFTAIQHPLSDITYGGTGEQMPMDQGAVRIGFGAALEGRIWH